MLNQESHLIAAQLQNDSGRKFSNKKMYAEAEMSFRKAIELAPDLAIAYNNLGWVIEMQGNTNEAIDCYEKALKVDPECVKAKTNYALLLTRLSRNAEALPVLRSLYTSYPDDPKLLNLFITNALHTGDLAAAAGYSHEL